MQGSARSDSADASTSQWSGTLADSLQPGCLVARSPFMRKDAKFNVPMPNLNLHDGTADCSVPYSATDLSVHGCENARVDVVTQQRKERMQNSDVQSDVMLDDVAPDVGLTPSISAVDLVKLDVLTWCPSHRLFIDKEDESITAPYLHHPAFAVPGSDARYQPCFSSRWLMHCRRPD